MNIVKRAILAPFAFAAIAASVQVMAAPIEHTITLEATIPTLDFHVMPTDGTWINDTQTLTYNPVTGALASLTKEFSVKHTAGSISGKLLAPAELISGTDKIGLTVKFNNKTLDLTAQEVVSKAAAATPSNVNLEIIPVQPAGAVYAPGTYTGNVQLSFDAVI